MSDSRNRSTEAGIAVQGAVRTALIWESDIDAASVGVAVTDGIVTLTGQVRTFKEVLAVRRRVLAVPGVHGIADELVVGPCEPMTLTDTMLAHRVVDVLGWADGVDVETIQVRVTGGAVELIGSVSTRDHAETAETLVSALRGVERVENHLVVTDEASARAVHASSGSVAPDGP
ncbi:BON domain-containing protein [Plantibacter flavus]|uniref:BON domain-containing protein n=1 Tax=Plantibacter flavus TaxID=150123 RepID=UPI00237908A6|nr:BON domain-containing protein [Plantibacter flavus]MDD9152890.1 BON domain-containing protein [Plantibacter flavus]